MTKAMTKEGVLSLDVTRVVNTLEFLLARWQLS
jgi:hypothetical protein